MPRNPSVGASLAADPHGCLPPCKTFRPSCPGSVQQGGSGAFPPPKSTLGSEPESSCCRSPRWSREVALEPGLNTDSFEQGSYPPPRHQTHSMLKEAWYRFLKHQPISRETPPATTRESAGFHMNFCSLIP